MLEHLRIQNFKSIVDLKLDLGRFNVFIGENGCGKTNLLEALALFAASAKHDLEYETLYSTGMRITKPSITFSSFVGRARKETIRIGCTFTDSKPFQAELICLEPDNILAKWENRTKWLRPDSAGLEDASAELGKIRSLVQHLEQLPERDLERIDADRFKHIWAGLDRLEAMTPPPSEVWDYLIYCLNTPALRGIQTNSRKLPLGIFGENLDLLISQFSPAELKELQSFSYLVQWLQDFSIDYEDTHKFQGHKLGKSTSMLYFRDRFMARRNNLFSAENANEGVLHVLFYLVLFISDKTPAFFGIDNIETSLNPKVCRTLIKELAALAKKHEKQALITTHNPAVLDGLNLFDDEQRLFVVSRSDEGHTRVKRIQLKPQADGEALKLSELWMRGVIGGLPVNF